MTQNRSVFWGLFPHSHPLFSNTLDVTECDRLLSLSFIHYWIVRIDLDKWFSTGESKKGPCWNASGRVRSQKGEFKTILWIRKRLQVSSLATGLRNQKLLLSSSWHRFQSQHSAGWEQTALRTLVGHTTLTGFLGWIPWFLPKNFISNNIRNSGYWCAL